MTAVHRLLSGLRALVRRRRDDADLNDELRAYLDAEIDARVAEGEDRTDATRAARAGLGSPLAIRDRVHDVGWEMSLEQFWADVREAARGLRWSPGFTIGVVITLALGIGVNVAMFTLLDTVLLRPLALPAPHELVVLHERGREGEPDTVGGTGRFLRFSYARYQLLQQALGANARKAPPTTGAWTPSWCLATTLRSWVSRRCAADCCCRSTMRRTPRRPRSSAPASGGARSRRQTPPSDSRWW
jgi:hypothetical protein